MVENISGQVHHCQRQETSNHKTNEDILQKYIAGAPLTNLEMTLAMEIIMYIWQNNITCAPFTKARNLTSHEH